MTVTLLAGFESGDLRLETGSANAALIGGAAFATNIVRTGVRSVRCNAASGVDVHLSLTGLPAGWVHFGVYFATLPTVTKVIFGSDAPSNINVSINSSGNLVYREATTVIATGATVITTGRWYWVGARLGAGTSVVVLQIDGLDEASGTPTGATAGNTLGFIGAEASAADAYFDDYIVDDTGFLVPSKVALLVPTADSAVGTGWTLGTGTAISANSGSTAVKNEPPVGVADLTAGSDTKQLRNATANANSNYDATLTTYAAAGIGPNDKVLAVAPIVATAAPVATSAKAGTVGVVSNPAIANVSLAAGGTAGAFWSGTAAGTYPTGWKASIGTLTANPAVTLGTAPVMRVTQVTSSTRIAMVCFVGLQVAWTPGARKPISEPGVFSNPGPHNVNQGVGRASSY